MAERKTSDTPILDEGVYRPGYQDTLTGRRDPVFGGARDLALDVAAGAIDVLGTPFAYARDAGRLSGDRSAELFGQLGQRGAIDLRNWVRSGKTEYGQQEDRTGNENRSWLGTAVDTVMQSAPAVAAAAATGPYAPLTFGALAGAQQSTEFEEKLYNMPREELERSPLYEQLKGEGMSHGDAVREIHARMRKDPAAWGPNVAANVLFGGVASRIMSRVGSRTVAQSMTQSILKNVGRDVPEGVVGGALTGLGQGYGRQHGEITGGLRDEMDWRDIGKESWEMGTTLGGISTATALARSRRPPPHMRGGRAPGDTVEKLLDDAGGRQQTVEIGTTERLVATHTLNDGQTTPAEKVGTTPPVGPAAINPEGSTARVTPAGTAEVPPEVTTPVRTPAETPVPPEGGIPPATGDVTAPTVAREAPTTPKEAAEGDWLAYNRQAAVELAEKLGLTDRIAELAKTKTAEEISKELGGKLDASEVRAVRDALGIEALGPASFAGVEIPGGPKAKTEADAEAVAEKVVAKQEAEKVAAETVGGPAKAVAAAKEGFTVEQLKTRAADVKQTPDIGTLAKHIEEWKKANPGQKLGEEINTIRKVNKEAREAERKRIDTEVRAEQKAKKEAKVKAAETAKTEKAHMGLAALSARAYAKVAKDSAAKARVQAENLKKKGKPEEATKKEEVTPEGKPPEVKTPEVKPEVKAEEPPPAKADPDLVRQKLGLPPRGTAVKHGAEAEAELAQIREKRGEAARAAWTPVIEGEQKRAETKVDTEGTAVRRDPKYTTRETTAKTVVEEHKAGPNKVADLEAKEAIIKDGKPDDTPVKEAVAELAKEAKEIFDDYKKRLEGLAGGKKDNIYTIAAKGGESRATSKGDYHGFISDLNNYVIKVNRALAKGNHTQAKELTLKYLADSKAVREGDMGTVVEERDYKNSAVSMLKRSYSNLEGKIDVLSKDDLEKLTPSEREAYDEALAKAQTEVDKEQAAGARKVTTDTLEEATEKALADNPAVPITKAAAKAGGISMPRRNAKGEIMRDRHGRMLMDDPAYPAGTITMESQYVTGKPDKLDMNKVIDLEAALDRASQDAGGNKLTAAEASVIFRLEGETVQRGTSGQVMMGLRPDNPYLRAIYDAVFDITKDMPVEIWSHDMMEAYYQHAYGESASLGFYTVNSGMTVLRTDAYTAPVIFHETLHAATSRAIRASGRLDTLVGKLQGIIESRYRTEITITADVPWQVAIRKANGERVNSREFVAELFSRPEVAELVQSVRLTAAEARALADLGYRADTGKSIMRSLWDGFLEAIGFREKNPNAMKVSVDLLQDMFEREMHIRQSDKLFGRTTGAFLSPDDRANLRNMDLAGGKGVGVTKAWEAGDFESVSRQLLDLNESGKLDDASSATAIKLLDRVNQHYWGGDGLVDDASNPVPIRGPEAIRSDVDGYLDSRFGRKLRDAGWQMENKFRTPMRKFFSGMQFTNDIGNTLGDAFKAIVHPIKQAWSNREHYAQEYMDVHGANKLVDKIASMKNTIKDRRLWDDFQRLLIRESYSRVYSDQPLGVGHNEHIKAGELKNRQTERDYKANKILLDHIAARNPELIKLRSEIYKFTRNELDRRLHHQAVDMLLRENIVRHGDEVGLSALAKNIRRQDISMTAAERTAMHRLLGDPDSKTHKDFLKKREDIRKIIDSFEKQGPHVPFMRHGKHAVFAEYDIRPKDTVKYNEVNPDKTGDLNMMYDFAKREDAEDFIDNTLGHPEVEISLRDAHEVVYDKNTGEIARDWRVEHRNGTATTFADEADARGSMLEGDKLRSRNVTPDDVKKMLQDGHSIGHLEVRHRVIFNPTEFVRFDSEREASQFREQLNQRFDTSHTMAAGPRMRTGMPQMTVKVTNVETPKNQISRANVAYTSAELQQWINRIEASETYQSMTKEQQAEWKREMRIEAARVTMTAGRRTMHLPREYARGASTDILRNMIDFSGSNARAVAELKYRDQIDKAVAAAEAHNENYRYQSGGLGRDARARDEALGEIKQRLYAPIRVEDGWAIGVKRALQVSMISHLADTGYLIINAMEPWVFGASISASRHGWINTYKEMAQAQYLIDPKELAKTAGAEIAAAFKGEYRASTYEQVLLDAVTGPRNKRGDGAELALMLQHMFRRGLVARDVGTEIERSHAPSDSMLMRGMDHVDGVFRGFNTGIETYNRGMMAVANFRLERARSGATFDTALKYSEDVVFKGAGDYSSWNNPRYFNNPFLKLAGQFKKYPLRIYSVYSEALTNAFKGDRQAQKQVAYMLLAQAVAAGGLGLPLASFGAGIVNAAYILGITDDNWDDVVFSMRKGLVDQIGVEGADLAMKGALRFSGADFSQKMSQGSIFFQGSPDSRKPGDLLKTVAMTYLGAPGDSGAKFIGGIQKIGEAAGHYAAGANEQAMQSGIEGAAGIIQIKILANIAKATAMAGGGYAGLPKGVEATTGQALTQAIGFQPTGIANKLEARRTQNREKKKDQVWRSTQVNRWVKAPDTEQAGIWAQIQKANQDVDPALRIQYQDLWKAKQRLKQQERRDDSKLGVRLSGRQKIFADHTRYFDVQ